MKTNEINYDQFVTYVHDNFQSKISRDKVADILHLEEDYNKDNPTSVGKPLLLKRLIFTGRKISEEEIKYDRKLYPGVNSWIADNSKGKSTIFKVIKYALTGTDSIKNDIKKWITEIILEFSIGKAVYTVYIDKSGRDKGALYSFSMDKLMSLKENQKLETIEKEKEFDFKSRVQLEAKMQDFFFDHFSYYTLKYNQRSSNKEILESSTVNLSWSTYFKSIYLESNNYEYLFFDNERYGAQGRKIFEMILGLRLTYPINMLTVQRDKVSEDIGKIKFLTDNRIEKDRSERSQIEGRLNEVKAQLIEISKAGIRTGMDDKHLVDEYERIQKRIIENGASVRTANQALESQLALLDSLNSEVANLQSDKVKISDEIKSVDKQLINLKLYQDAGSFFSNLDVKMCPHCETGVTESKRQKEVESRICSLCGEHPTIQKVEDDEIKEKIHRLTEEKSSHSEKVNELKKSINDRRTESTKLQEKVNQLQQVTIESFEIAVDRDRLIKLEGKIADMRIERDKDRQKLENYEKLREEQAVLVFRLGEIEKVADAPETVEHDRLLLKREILNYALEALERKRLQLNKDIVDKLEQLILNEIHTFGLTSITKIQINDKYELVFTQNSVLLTFGELNEGEKLRVKLAFYLSLIQLDIEHNLGRHPRFLIFDSPGSEEMIEEHLHGLSDVLKSMNTRFKNKLQIFIGSAVREFSDITDAERSSIHKKGEFVF